MKNIDIYLQGLRKQTTIKKYEKILYFTAPFSICLLLLIPFVLLVFRLLIPSVYSPIIGQVFWHESYFHLSVLGVFATFFSIPLVIIPGYSFISGDYKSYKHLIISKQNKLRLVLLFLAPIISLSLSWKTIPGFFVFLLSQGYLIPLYLITTFVLTWGAGIFTFIANPISHAFKLKSSTKLLPSLVGFTYLRPSKSSVINLDVGAFSPRLKVVTDELKIWNSLVENSAPTSRDIWHYAQGVHDNISPVWLRKTANLMWKGVNDLRIEVADIVKLDPQNIIFVSSTTRAIQVALETLQPKSIVTTNFEHPTENCLMDALHEKYGTEIFKIEVKGINTVLWKDEFIAKFVKECVDRQASVALISHVSYINGWRLPVEEICQELFQQSPTTSVIIDGAHAIGNIDVDLSKIPFTFYAFSGHKWLFSSINIGVLATSDTVRSNQVMLTKLSNEIHESLSIHHDQPIDDESNSSINLDAMVAFSASIKSLKETKLDYVMENMRSLKKHFQKAASNYSSFRILDEITTKIPIVPGIINVQNKNRNLSYDELKGIEKELEQKYGIIVNAIKSPSQNFPDVIRVCLPFYLWEHEVTKAVNAINKAFS